MPNRDDYGSDFDVSGPTNSLPSDAANFAATGLKRTAKVGFSRPNRLGLFDMHGNVFELCDDLLFDGSGGPLRALRGGGWLDPAEFCRAWCCNVIRTIPGQGVQGWSLPAGMPEEDARLEGMGLLMFKADPRQEAREQGKPMKRVEK